MPYVECNIYNKLSNNKVEAVYLFKQMLTSIYGPVLNQYLSQHGIPIIDLLNTFVYDDPLYYSDNIYPSFFGG